MNNTFTTLIKCWLSIKKESLYSGQCSDAFDGVGITVKRHFHSNMKLLKNYCKLLLTFCMVSTGVYSMSIEDSKTRQSPATPITMEESISGAFGAAGYGGSWENDNEIRTVSSKGKITITNANDNSIVTEIDYTPHIDAILGQNNHTFAGMSFSADKRYILITHERTSLWRYSNLAKYTLFDTITNASEPLQPDREVVQQPQLQLVRWSPTGNALAFVHGNDLYYRQSAAIASVIKRITTSGEENIIFNGHTDWVYEEEMFGTNNALWFSPNSDKLAYVQFNDTNVEQFTFLKYGEPGDRNTVYPKTITMNYPKSGTANPTYKLFVVPNLTPNIPPSVDITLADSPNMHYIASVDWATNTQLSFVVLDRPQENALTYLWSGGNAVSIAEYKEADGWIDVYPPKFNADGSRFLTLEFTAPSHHKHIVIRDSAPSSTPSPLTIGEINVNSILSWDETNGKIYFSATYSNGTGNSEPSQTQIYSMDADPTTNDTVCLTCGIENPDHTTEICLSNSVSFNPSFTSYIHRCSGPNIPYTVIRAINGSVINKVVNNAELRTKLVAKILPKTKELLVPVVGTNYQARVRLLLPPDLDENDTEKTYPLLIDVYAGPSSQQIGQGFGINWGTSLVSDKNIIYGFIDARGSAKQSKQLMFELNKKLGTVEIEDQIAVTEALIGSQKYIDANRTAIWGWSYGGYATAMAMSKDTEGVFKCGISVAPVTNWLYYDTIYTERYMKLPTNDSNWEGYESSDVTSVKNIENIKNKNFFLVHGNADDNVHYQQSMILSRALEQNDIMFRQLSYPDENHSINGRGMRRHLYHSLEKFLFSPECFVDYSPNTASSHIQHSTLLVLVFSLFLHHLY